MTLTAIPVTYEQGKRDNNSLLLPSELVLCDFTKDSGGNIHISIKTTDGLLILKSKLEWFVKQLDTATLVSLEEFRKFYQL